METVNELRELCGNRKLTPRNRNFVSQTFGASRTLLNYLESPTIAYGYGFNNCVFFIRTVRKKIKAFFFQWANPFSEYDDKATEIDLEEGIELLKNPLLVKKEYDYRYFTKEGNLKEQYEEKVILKVKSKNDANCCWRDGYKLLRDKKNQIQVRYKWWIGTPSKKYPLASFYGLIVRKEIDVPKEIVREIKDKIFVDQL